MKISCDKMWVIIIMLVALSAAHAQVWSQGAVIPTPRWYPASVVLDNMIYVIGGQDSISPYSSLNTVEVYDPYLDQWQTRASLAYDRWGSMTAAVGGKIYTIGGQYGSFYGGYTSSDAVEEYDPVTDTWTVKTSMPTPRGWGGCAVFHDTIFVFGGYSTQYGHQVKVEKYYPCADTWSSDPDMPQTRYTFMTGMVNDKIYLIGGWYSSLVQEYDPVTKIWTSKTPMLHARGGSGYDVANNKIYIVGGRGGANRFEYYDPATDTWDSLSYLPTPREGLIAGIVSNRLYAITGSDASGLPYYGINEIADSFTTVLENRPVSKHVTTFCSVPNPFSDRTSILCCLPYACDIDLAVYDITGKKVKVLAQGRHDQENVIIEWDGTDSSGRRLSDGIYFLKLRYGSNSVVQKCMLLR